MKDDEKTKDQLVHELAELHSKNAELEKTITGSIAAQLVVEEISRYAESIVETIREPLIVLDATLKIISANKNFYTTFKATPAETIGTFIYDLGNKQWDVPKLQKLLEEILPEKEAFDGFEVDHDFQDIGHKIMILNARQIYRKDIGTKMILLAIEDITERREIENGLEKTRIELAATKISEDEVREYAESLINTIREPLIALDQDLRVVKVSSSFYELFKVKPEETMGQLIYDLGNKQWDIPKLRELLENILPEKATFDNYEVEHDFATIGRRTMLLNARQIQRVLGKERIILLAIEDITERKEVDTRLMGAMADLERSNKDLEQFAYVASHDLQEPLRMVSSYTQLLAKHYEGRLDEKAKKFMDYAIDGAVRMQRLINDLLTYSRIGTRSAPLATTDTHALLGEAIRNLAAMIEEKHAIITNDDLPTVMADASQLMQVFQNLISNAIKFQGDNVPHIHVSAQDKVSEWLFSIRDNGVGIDRQYADRVFVIFQRLHTRHDYPGTGIGLALCKRIVERHGGRIWFESEPGKGSTFFFTVTR